MKRLFFTLILLITSLSLFSQEHLKFKGVPINGSLKTFVESMKVKGFSLIDSQDVVALMKGTFAGVSSCKIFIVSANDVVWKVAVEFPSNDKWPEVKRDYNDLKESFATKYGITPEVQEMLPHEEEYYSTSGGMIILHDEFDNEKAVYDSYFIIPNGVAIVGIKPDFRTSGCLQVVIEYYDDINTQFRDKKAMEDL